MESFDMFLNGNFVALPAFQKKYGVPSGDGFAIPTRWQSALFQSGQCGAFVGVFLAGPITTRLGYRWTTIWSLVLMNATIFVSFFVSISTSLSFPPNSIPSGQFPRPSSRRTDFGRHSLGSVYCQLASVCVRNCAPCSSRRNHVYPANELVDRWYHCGGRHIWIPQRHR